MGRLRKNDKHLPRRVYIRHGAYYFVDHIGKWHRLGASLGEMYRALAEHVEESQIIVMDDLLARYLRDVVPQKAERTQVDNRAQIARLRCVFGHMRPSEITAPDICAFRDKRGAQYPTAANRELEVLAHALQRGVEWGALKFNPCREVRKLKLPRRNRYVADWEFAVVHSIASPRMKVAMDLALLTGLRRGDLLSLTRDDLTDDGILIRPAKTEHSSGKVLLIEWSDELRAVIAAAKKLRPQVRRHVIANMQGKPYTPTGFGSVWRTLMLKALKETELQEPFRFNDLRAKSASDDSLAAATERLGHTDVRTTKEFYRRRPVRVQPLR